ncbi:DEAD/DEAH box helicase [Kitasatospora sp. NBC_00458]|uniref:DEAD/DEAH box helicase n=1 Tax=Kitasatospora sp. NBC_00458 TaxID=2903568 RepID=UPI002E1814F6
MGVPHALARVLTRQGITEPSAIQAATLPAALAGRDVLGRGRTGSGKTLAYGLPLLARTAGRCAEPGRPVALVLVPTRELAQQVGDDLRPYALAARLRLTALVGGLPVHHQALALKRGAEVAVATPGRLADLVRRGDCALDGVAVTVVDEADRMAELGFLHEVTELLDRVGADGQTMLYSATLDGGVDRLAERFLRDPVSFAVDPPTDAVDTMEHHVLYVRQPDKRSTVTHIASRAGASIMFAETRDTADRTVEDLLAGGVRAAALHSGKSQPQRTRTLEQFRAGVVTALVATNVAARGLHVDGLDLVVNIDPPSDPKDYLHRSGRTARAGAAGTVVTLVLPGERRDTARMLTAAGVTPACAQVRPGSEELSRITGARPPSAVPVTVPDPVPDEPPRWGSAVRRPGGR